MAFAAAESAEASAVLQCVIFFCVGIWSLWRMHEAVEAMLVILWVAVLICGKLTNSWCRHPKHAWASILAVVNPED